MKYALFAVVVLLFVSAAHALPSYYNYVNDYANVIDPASESQLNEYITWLEENTTSEVAVLTVNDTEGVSERTYATDVFNTWGIGKAKQDNGVLVLVVMSTRRIEIEVGYGLEGRLPDGKVGRIIRDNTDYFREGNYSSGIAGIVYALGSEIQKESFEGSGVVSVIFPIILFLFFFVLFIAAITYGIVGNRCPKCKAKLVSSVKETKEEIIVEKRCPKCGYVKKERKKKSHLMFVPVVIGGGSGHGGGSFGGFGGGGSGGAGAGGSW